MRMDANWYQLSFVSKFYVKKDIYVNRLESVICDMYMSILQTRTKCNGRTPRN